MRHDSSISSRGARRLLEAVPPADAPEQQVAAVLTALAPADASDAHVPEAVLAAFAHNAGPGRPRESHAGRGRARSGTRALRGGRAATIKAGVVVLAVSSGTVAAAAADILPAPAQRAVHSLFGSWGVPAPHTSHGTGTVSPSAPAHGFPATSAPGAASAQPGLTRPGSAPATGSACSGMNTHGADTQKCAGSDAAAGSVAPSAGHATKSADHGHTPNPTPTPRGGAAR